MLDIDLVTILAEILNFLVLAVGLYFLFFKPVKKRMETRAQEKKDTLAEAHEKEMLANQRLSEIEARLENIDQEIEKRLQEAYEQAQAESEALLEATHREAVKIIGSAEKEASKRQQQELANLQADLVDSI